MIELRKIDHDNFEAVLEIKLAEGQRVNVMPISHCIAEAYVDMTAGKKPPMLFAIYSNDQVVGFVEIGFYQLDEDLEDDEWLYFEFGDKATYEVSRFMIDEKHQGCGIGRAAMVAVIEFVKTSPQGAADSISLSYWDKNEAARRLFASVGFVEVGHREALDEGEVGARYAIR
ncbi:MAG: GNAT family N-acetyltransferase [Defluviitaleaceae bacterium]|nr:GNAT family N-acetyltransferase [Defluviitaleaceae bacterium]